MQSRPAALAALITLLLGMPVTVRAQVADWSWDRPVSDETLVHALPVIQERLRLAGCYAGEPDGRLGPMTRGAIAAFHKAIGIKARPVVSERLVDAALNRPVRCARPGAPAREPAPLPGAGGPSELAEIEAGAR